MKLVDRSARDVGKCPCQEARRVTDLARPDPPGFASSFSVECRRARLRTSLHPPPACYSREHSLFIDWIAYATAIFAQWRARRSAKRRVLRRPKTNVHRSARNCRYVHTLLATDCIVSVGGGSDTSMERRRSRCGRENGRGARDALVRQRATFTLHPPLCLRITNTSPADNARRYTQGGTSGAQSNRC